LTFVAQDIAGFHLGKTDFLPKGESMFPMHRYYLVFLFFALLFAPAACTSRATREPELTQPVQPDQPPVATADPLLATPLPVLGEQPLQGRIPEIPTIFIVPSRQSKLALAEFLKTTPEQLGWVNPGLPDPIVPGTLVVIPPVYRTGGETLSEIAQKTGLSEELLWATNPQLEDNEPLVDGMILAVPALYIFSNDTPLSSAAATLGTSDEALLSANPELAAQKSVLAGTVLVVPPKSEER
jgi:hypothetical protein